MGRHFKTHSNKANPGKAHSPLILPCMLLLLHLFESYLHALKARHVLKKVLTVGVFDYFHLGHLNLFEHAKQFGDYLIVAVQDGDCILKTTEQRKHIVGSLKVVDEVITYRDVDALMPEVDFDVFAVGGDQNHEGFKRAEQWCLEHGREVVHLDRTPGICSSGIKTQLESLK